MKPDALNPPPPPPPPPGMTAERPLSPCAEPSQTERKHSTWFASPDATARHAFTTEPSCPDVSSPLAVPAALRGAARPSRRTRPRRRSPAGVPIGPGYVEMPSMSAVVEPGVLDRGEAPVERELERVAEQPPADLGLTDAARCTRAAR